MGSITLEDIYSLSCLPYGTDMEEDSYLSVAVWLEVSLD